jgi:signal transduction histidine kinase
LSRLRGHQVLALSGVLVLVALVALPLDSAWWIVPIQVATVLLALFLCLPVGPSRVPAPLAATACAIVAADVGFDAFTGLDAGEELTELPLLTAVAVVIVSFTHSVMSRRERDFVRSTSHQLRTPLTVALSHAELIQQSLAARDAPQDAGRDADGSQLEEDVAIVVEELKRVSAVSNRLLLMDVEQSRTSLGDVDVGRLVVGTIRRWQSTVGRRWVASVAARGTFPGDEEQLSIALDSLVENALKATTEGDQIVVSGRAEGTDIVISVSDTGCGIAEASRKRVLERRRLVFLRKAGDQEAATGLGLAIVKGIVERHGGRLDVDRRPGEGTTFTFRLGGFRPAVPRPLAAARPGEVVPRHSRDLVA